MISVFLKLKFKRVIQVFITFQYNYCNHCSIVEVFLFLVNHVVNLECFSLSFNTGMVDIQLNGQVHVNLIKLLQLSYNLYLILIYVQLYHRPGWFTSCLQFCHCTFTFNIQLFMSQKQFTQRKKKGSIVQDWPWWFTHFVGM